VPAAAAVRSARPVAPLDEVGAAVLRGRPKHSALDQSSTCRVRPSGSVRPPLPAVVMRRLEPFAASCVSVETARVFALDNMASAAAAKCRSAQAECLSHVLLQLHRLASGRDRLSDLVAVDDAVSLETGPAPLDASTPGWCEVHSTERDLWNGLRDVCIDRAPADVRLERLMDVLSAERIEALWATKAAFNVEMSLAFKYIQLAVLPAISLLSARVEAALKGQHKPSKADRPSDSEEDEPSENGPRRWPERIPPHSLSTAPHQPLRLTSHCAHIKWGHPQSCPPSLHRSSRWLCRAVVKADASEGDAVRGDGVKEAGGGATRNPSNEVALGEHPWHPVPLGTAHQVRTLCACRA
jgi:hypothetical protein